MPEKQHDSLVVCQSDACRFGDSCQSLEHREELVTIDCSIQAKSCASSHAKMLQLLQLNPCEAYSKMLSCSSIFFASF